MDKILLIAPYYEGWTGFHLGLASLSSYLLNRGYNTDIVDLTKEKLANEKFVKNHNFPKCVGITCTTSTYQSALDLANQIKEKQPNTTIIFGGPHVSYTPKETLRNQPVDMVVIGEGWKTLEEILEEKPLGQILGIAYKKENQVKINPARPRLKNLDKLPFPDRRKAKNYSIEHFSYGKKSTSVITSLGCINKCGFCSASNYWGKVRTRSIDNVIEELRQLKENGFENIYFEDDIFIFDKNRVYDFSKRLFEENLNIDWHIETRVDSIDEKLLEIMAKAGLRDIFFGIESGSNEILKAMKKKVNLEDGIKAFKLCKKYGIRTLASIQIGYLGESDETINETINYLHRLNPNKILPAITSVYPGTPLFYQLGLPKDVYEIRNLETPELRRWKVEHNNHGAGAIHPPFIAGLPIEAYSDKETFEKIYPNLSDSILAKLSAIYQRFLDEFGDKIESPR